LRPLEEGVVSRPGWESFDEKVENIRIAGATFKNLVKLASQYRQTVESGVPKGFRPDLLTRLYRNIPVTSQPIWMHFVPDGRYDKDLLRDQFCYILSEFKGSKEKNLSFQFWGYVYDDINQRIEKASKSVIGHLPDTIGRRRHYASRITARFFNGLIGYTKEGSNRLDTRLRDYLERMMDFLLADIGQNDD